MLGDRILEHQKSHFIQLCAVKELPTTCQSVQDVPNSLHFQETKKRGESAKRKKCWGGEQRKWEKKSSVKLHTLEVSDIGCGVLILFRIRAVKFSFFVIIVIILMPQNDTHSSNISRIQFVLLQNCRLILKDNWLNLHSVSSYNLQLKHVRGKEFSECGTIGINGVKRKGKMYWKP